MKIGMRKPSIKKSISARTTGRGKRAIKRAVNPAYGKKGMGWVNNPKKAAYNKVYNKTTMSYKDLGNSKSTKNKTSTSEYASVKPIPVTRPEKKKTGTPWFIFGVLFLIGSLGSLPSFGPFAVGLVLGGFLLWKGLSIRKANNTISVNTGNDQLTGLKLLLIPDLAEQNVSYNELLNMAMEQADNRIRISKDCVKIINETSKTDVFFDRFNLLINNLQYLALLEDYLRYTESNPTSDLESLLKEKTEIVNRFFDRVYADAMTLKTETGRKNRIDKFKLELTKYNDFLNPENITYLNSMSE